MEILFLQLDIAFDPLRHAGLPRPHGGMKWRKWLVRHSIRSRPVGNMWLSACIHVRSVLFCRHLSHRGDGHQ